MINIINAAYDKSIYDMLRHYSNFRHYTYKRSHISLRKHVPYCITHSLNISAPEILLHISQIQNAKSEVTEYIVTLKII